MKRIAALFLAILLLAANCALAQGSYTARCGGKTLCTVSYDDAKLRLDTESYLGAGGGRHTWLGTFYDGEYTVEMAADQYADLPSGSGADQLSAYLCTAMQGEGAREVGRYRGAGPEFVILSLNGPAGGSYYAAALTGGYVVYFEIYNLRGGVDAGALAALKALLNGVK